jgi:hypothetical protein
MARGSRSITSTRARRHGTPPQTTLLERVETNHRWGWEQPQRLTRHTSLVLTRAQDSSLYSMHERVAHLPYFWNSQSLLSARSRKSVRRSEKMFLPPLQCSEQLSPFEVIFAHSSPPRPHAGRVPHSIPDTKRAHRKTLRK